MDIIRVDISNDKTKKYFIKISPNEKKHIEACLLCLPQYGYIICISSQIGCSQKCKFCAAGNDGFVRNLTFEEIIEQVQLVIDNNPQLLNVGFQITYMGSGEPLSNYENVFESIDSFRKKYLMLTKVNISTTCPIQSEKCFNQIDWTRYKDFIHFQYSLHFTSDDERYKFLWPKLLKIDDAIKYLNSISTVINDVYKINYIPFNDVNDGEKDIKKLIGIMNNTNNAKLKISCMCDVFNSTFLPSKNFEEFVNMVKSQIEDVVVFRSDGTDVNAGCGQFYNESII